MTRRRYGLYSCGLYSCGLYSYGLYSCGLYGCVAPIVMAYIGMTCRVMVCIVMAYKVMACITKRMLTLTKADVDIAHLTLGANRPKPHSIKRTKHNLKWNHKTRRAR